MLTNRPEWLSGCFGASLAAGVATGISTFSTPDELDYLLRSSGVSVLLFERTVDKKDFPKILFELEPKLASSAPGQLQSTLYPFLQHIASVAAAQAPVANCQLFLHHSH